MLQLHVEKSPAKHGTAALLALLRCCTLLMTPDCTTARM
jgi:hypothetical protein